MPSRALAGAPIMCRVPAILHCLLQDRKDLDGMPLVLIAWRKLFCLTVPHASPRDNRFLHPSGGGCGGTQDSAFPPRQPPSGHSQPIPKWETTFRHQGHWKRYFLLPLLPLEVLDSASASAFAVASVFVSALNCTVSCTPPQVPEPLGIPGFQVRGGGGGQ